ncbi:polypyrimidine tract-binding protein homolog 3-like [Phalaenopsis equestris]|uniref:polypyrimidine tract-binding protein homolog 3-like n=1 Tax=Phalaenopsis equestris TaxID=78828 RepID=UPI0009E569DE|nr:polypyrimidine tract-binding protein homolog 3-like [Phalaenopsis equestris]
MMEPSKVIHVRNVGHEINENDLLQLVQPFGVVVKLVILRAKNQALIQMYDVSTADNVLQYYGTVQPSIRGRNVYMQFSSHQELTAMDPNYLGSKGGEQGVEPNRILLVTIHSLLYPITVEVLHQVFSPYGFVEKIVTFHKLAGFQALIQYQDITAQSGSLFSSSYSISGYHGPVWELGRNIYDGCCQLDIQFSNLNELQVNCNNDRSRDFTNPSLPTEQRGHPSQMGNGTAIAAAFGGVLLPGMSGVNEHSTILLTNLNPEKIDEDKLFNLFSMYGNIVRIKLLRSKPDHALVQMADGNQAELALRFLKGAMLFGKKLELTSSKYPTITPTPDTREFARSNLNRFNNNTMKNYRHCCAPTQISAFPLDSTEDEISTHLAEHGAVVSTKLIEANGKRQALVLFENEEQATEALVCKHGSSIRGSVIRIAFSQMQAI